MATIKQPQRAEVEMPAEVCDDEGTDAHLRSLNLEQRHLNSVIRV